MDAYLLNNTFSGLRLLFERAEFFQGVQYEDYGFLGCDAVCTGR